MARRNLHEAFEQVERARERARLREEAEIVDERRPRARTARVSDRSGSEVALVHLARSPLLWLALLLSFSIGFLVGRGARPAAAGEPTTTDTAGTSPWIETPRTGGTGGPRGLVPNESLGDSYLVEMEVELFDLANQFTIQVITYDHSQRNLRWAQDLVSHLASRDLPVAPPQVVGDNIVVLVGASPTKEGLASLEARVRVLEDAAGKKSFGDALIVPIDALLDRG